MADAYQGLAPAGDIGALLRLIQEEKSQSVLAAPPAVEPGSPTREMVTDPLMSPESPGSTRIASIKPEGLGPNEVGNGELIGGGDGIQMPHGLAQGIAPVGPSISGGNPGGNPGGGNGGGGSAPSIGTTIKASTPVAQKSSGMTAQQQQLYNTVKSFLNIPMRSTRGQLITKPPTTPTPTPFKGTIQKNQKPSTGNAWRA